MNYTITVPLTLRGEDVEAQVEFDFLRGAPGRWYMPNGDPGYPDEPDELEVNSIVIDGHEHEGLPVETLDAIEQACWDWVEDHWQTIEADRAERNERERHEDFD